MTDSPYYPDHAPFSAGYTLVRNADVRTWSEDETHMDVGLYSGLVREFGDPIVGYVGGLHYQFKPSREVLSGKCAIPKSSHGRASDPSALLIRK